MRKWIIAGILLVGLTISGCAFFEGLWSGLTGQETGSQKTGKVLVQSATEITDEVKATGKLDINKVVALMDALKEYQKQSESERPNWLELAGTIIGLSATTYLGTRRLRYSKVGSFINGILGLLDKSSVSKKR